MDISVSIFAPVFQETTHEIFGSQNYLHRP